MGPTFRPRIGWELTDEGPGPELSQGWGFWPIHHTASGHQVCLCSPLCISQSTFLFWGEILHYFCFVLGRLLSLSLLTRGNKRNKQKQGISCSVAIDIGLAALQRARHLRLEWKRVPPPPGQTRGPRGSQSAHQSSLIGSIHQPDTAVSRLTKSEF